MLNKNNLKGNEVKIKVNFEELINNLDAAIKAFQDCVKAVEKLKKTKVKNKVCNNSCFQNNFHICNTYPNCEKCMHYY